MKDFIQKVAVITGAGSGIGSSLAVQLSQAGADLALCDLNLESLEHMRELLSSQVNISLHTVDVSSMVQMAQFAQDVLENHGNVDLLINNAGITLTPKLFEDISEEQFERVVDVNMWGVYNGIRVYLPHLKTRPEASIVNISSSAGLVGLYGYSPYVMGKFAIRGLTESLQSELVGTNVSLLIVHPGGVKTNLIKNAPDLNDSQQRQAAHDNFTKFAWLTSDKVAEKILQAVKKNKRQLVIGTDARLVNAIRGMFPGRFPKILRAVFSQADFK